MTEVNRVTQNDPKTMQAPSHDIATPEDRIWILVPLIAFGGVVVSQIAPPILSAAGIAGCFLASFLLALLAYRKPKKDIVSLLTPLYAVLIFANPDFDPMLLLQIQVLYAASLTVLVLRLNARFSRKDEARRMITEQEEFEDEQISE
jgi:hypothetical protein